MIRFLLVNSTNETIAVYDTMEDAETALYYAGDDHKIAAVVLPNDCREWDQMRERDEGRVVE